MTDPQRLVLGVTGNIAVGKSTVVSILTDLGAHYIDADLVYRDLVAPDQPLLRTLADHFGEHIIGEDGGLDRKTLGSIVFSDPEALKLLDRLTHPAIIAETDRRVDAIRDGVIIIDAIKLIESGHSEVCDVVWLVTAPQDDQVSRLVQRNKLSKADALDRVAAQPPLEPKIAGSDLVIDNAGSLNDLRKQVMDAWRGLTQSKKQRRNPFHGF